MEPLDEQLESIETRLKILKEDPDVLDEEKIKKEILNYLIEDNNEFDL